MDEGGYELVLEFPDQSPSFAHGFTCGKLWRQMQVDVDPIEAVVVKETREMIVRMGAALGWSVHFAEISDNWVKVTLTRSKRPHLAAVTSG